mmetsp:Transcript_18064/g.36641  ORF Transcript_18064/g.36641 Transcript_18064/m.36641 type:complete len:274 (-) Transcript_18064:296-1117(-)
MAELTQEWERIATNNEPPNPTRHTFQLSLKRMYEAAHILMVAVLNQFRTQPAVLPTHQQRWFNLIDRGIAVLLKERATAPTQWTRPSPGVPLSGARPGASVIINLARLGGLSPVHRKDASDLRLVRLVWTHEWPQRFLYPKPSPYLVRPCLPFNHTRATACWRLGVCWTAGRQIKFARRDLTDLESRCRACRQTTTPAAPADELHALTGCCEHTSIRSQLTHLVREKAASGELKGQLPPMDASERLYVQALGPLLRADPHATSRLLHRAYEEL